MPVNNRNSAHSPRDRAQMYVRPGARRKKSLLPVIVIAACTLLAVLLAVFLPRACSGGDGVAPVSAAVSATPAPSAAVSSATPAPTQTPAPVRTVDPYLVIRPVADPGYLPIFEKANIRENQICITVDDCFQGDNLNAILDLCETYGAKITIFPIGKNTVRESLHEPLRRAYEMGMEFENHSYNHSAFYRLYDEDMAAEIYNANLALNSVLGVNYHMRFMRTRGGDNRYDLRTHNYIAKLGYYGMAHWSVDGSKSSTQQLANSLSPGQIYLFHTTDNDLELLSFFIPYVAQQGYEMLTLTEMFGYPDNEVTPLTEPVAQTTPTPPDPYVYEYKTLSQNTSYIWDVSLLQLRLVELGFLKDSPDGVYGNNTFMAVGYFQLAAGLEATGIATPETQEVLFSDAAPTAAADGAAAPTTPAPSAAPETPQATAQAGPTPVHTTAPRHTGPEPTVDLTLFD